MIVRELKRTVKRRLAPHPLLFGLAHAELLQVEPARLLVEQAHDHALAVS